MAKQATKTAAQQPAAAAAAVNVAWRIVVRGTNAQGVRQRGVHTVQAPVDGNAAWDQAGAAAQAMAVSKGWAPQSVFWQVYPPVGVLCNGGISKGFAVVDGYVVRAK